MHKASIAHIRGDGRESAEHEDSQSLIRSLVAHVVLACSFGITLLTCVLFAWRRPLCWKQTGNIAVVGTFHNTGWFTSHAAPLAGSGCRSVVFVADAPLPAPAGVRFACPPRWMGRLLGRAASKLLWLIVVGWRHKPDLYMGYHIFPGALTALIVARLMGRPACYQMTGGPIEVLGGGVHNENLLMSGLRRPSAYLERLAMAVVRQFDLVVVRGEGATRFLRERGANGAVAVIPGSVRREFFEARGERDVDLIFVGRLSEIKQPLQFVEIVAAVNRQREAEAPAEAPPEPVRATIVGDGPLAESVRRHAEQLGVFGRIQFVGKSRDVMSLLVRSRIFVLTSRSEGLSIAMAEAMAAGVVPVVADVGELRDLVVDGVNGRLIAANDVDAFARRIAELLNDSERWDEYSRAAVESARRYCHIDAVAEMWHDRLRAVAPRDRCGQMSERPA